MSVSVSVSISAGDGGAQYPRKQVPAFDALAVVPFAIRLLRLAQLLDVRGPNAKIQRITFVDFEYIGVDFHAGTLLVASTPKPATCSQLDSH